MINRGKTPAKEIEKQYNLSVFLAFSIQTLQFNELPPIYNYFLAFFLPAVVEVTSKSTHDVRTTLLRRRFNSLASLQRLYNVISTSCVGWVGRISENLQLSQPAHDVRMTLLRRLFENFTSF